MLRQPLAASEDCKAALSADPGFHRARLRLATCKLRMGGFCDARSALEPLLSSKDSKTRADARTKLKEIDDAEESAAQATVVLASSRGKGWSNERFRSL